MKVLIVNTMAPFIWGGAEELATHLQKNLIIAGHESEILRIPFQWNPASRIPSQMLMVKALELYGVDHVVALKFPAYLIRHPKKTLWLIHQFRQAYDLFDAKQTHLLPENNGLEVREMIKNADDLCFSECRNIFTNSVVTHQRLMKYNGFESKVLPPPVNDPELFLNKGTDNYILAAGRINSMKRQNMLLEAMSYTDQKVKLIIAGPPDTSHDAMVLKNTLESYDLKDRVVLDLGFLSRQRYADYINHAAAVAYIPFDEDSFGYVTMEAATASKALITTTDSGGILGLVKHEETGWVAEPNPQALAIAMNSAMRNKNLTESYGQAAKTLLKQKAPEWPKIVEMLLQ